MDEDCAGYDCIGANQIASCPAGQFLANEDTCVTPQDCLCVDYKGNPIKVYFKSAQRFHFSVLKLCVIG